MLQAVTNAPGCNTAALFFWRVEPFNLNLKLAVRSSASATCGAAQRAMLLVHSAAGSHTAIAVPCTQAVDSLCIEHLWRQKVLLGLCRNAIFSAAMCMQLPKADAEQTAKKRATMPLQDIAELVFSYKSLIKIENLWGLDRLVKLKLDCNGITKIENLDHLVRE